MRPDLIDTSGWEQEHVLITDALILKDIISRLDEVLARSSLQDADLTDAIAPWYANEFIKTANMARAYSPIRQAITEIRQQYTDAKRFRALFKWTHNGAVKLTFDNAVALDRLINTRQYNE